MTTNNGNVPTACKRAPPKFTDGMLYKTWQNKIEMWELVTNVPLNKRGIIVLLDSLEGNAKDEKAVHEMKLPNTVLTFKLLDGAKISDDERKLVLTFCSDLQFEK